MLSTCSFSTLVILKLFCLLVHVFFVLAYVFINFTHHRYYGLFMWFPELFTRIELYGGSACAPKPVESNVTAVTPTAGDDIANTIYFEGFLTAISNLPGNILTIFIIDRVGRKILLSE